MLIYEVTSEVGYLRDTTLLIQAGLLKVFYSHSVFLFFLLIKKLKKDFVSYQMCTTLPFFPLQEFFLCYYYSLQFPKSF